MGKECLLFILLHSSASTSESNVKNNSKGGDTSCDISIIKACRKECFHCLLIWWCLSSFYALLKLYNVDLMNQLLLETHVGP